MENLLLLKNENEQKEIYYAIDADKIETLNVSDTYDGFGQSVDDAVAGDSLILNTQAAVDLANHFYDENNDSDEHLNNYKIEDCVSAYEHKEYDQIIESDLIEDADYTTYKETCKGFNFWNGNNWKSIIVACENDYTPWTVITDADLIKKLKEAIENKELVKDTGGKTEYTDGEYIINESRYASDWANYIISYDYN